MGQKIYEGEFLYGARTNHWTEEENGQQIPRKTVLHTPKLYSG